MTTRRLAAGTNERDLKLQSPAVKVEQRILIASLDQD